MKHALSIALLLAAAPAAWAGLGVFINGHELTKENGWASFGPAYYDPSRDEFVLASPPDHETGLFQATITGTNREDDVSILLCRECAVRIENLVLRTTETNKPPVKIDDDAEVTLYLAGDNRVEAAPWAAGVQLGKNASLVVTNAPGDEAASLVAVGGDYGAGIGDGHDCDTATSLVIAGGVIEACGHGRYAAGIGQGNDGRVKNFAMSGGTVRARGDGGADFASGFNAAYATQTITGGSLDARSWDGGAPCDAAGDPVQKVSIRCADWSPGQAVSVVFADSGFPYGTTGIFADEESRIHLWLPAGSHSFEAGGIPVSVEVQFQWIEVELDGASFDDWCARFGIKPFPGALTDGEPNILRYVFGTPSGPLPMPTLDPAPEYPTAVMPPRKYKYPDSTLLILGTTDLSRPIDRWFKFYPDKDDPDLWKWTGAANPKSLFIRYRIEYSE